MTKQVCTKLAKLNEQRLRNRVTTGVILYRSVKGCRSVSIFINEFTVDIISQRTQMNQDTSRMEITSQNEQ